MCGKPVAAGGMKTSHLWAVQLQGAGLAGARAVSAFGGGTHDRLRGLGGAGLSSAGCGMRSGEQVVSSRTGITHCKYRGNVTSDRFCLPM